MFLLSCKVFLVFLCLYFVERKALYCANLCEWCAPWPLNCLRWYQFHFTACYLSIPAEDVHQNDLNSYDWSSCSISIFKWNRTHGKKDAEAKERYLDGSPFNLCFIKRYMIYTRTIFYLTAMFYNILLISKKEITLYTYICMYIVEQMIRLNICIMWTFLLSPTIKRVVVMLT